MKTETYTYKEDGFLIKKKVFSYGIGFYSSVSTVITSTIASMPFMFAPSAGTLIASVAVTAIGAPLVTKFTAGLDASHQIQEDNPFKAGPRLKETRTLVESNVRKGTETYVTRGLRTVTVETRERENPGATWDRVYKSLLEVHNLQETDYMVYADSGDEGHHTIPWKHGLNKALKFTGYGIYCECKTCTA